MTKLTVIRRIKFVATKYLSRKLSTVECNEVYDLLETILDFDLAEPDKDELDETIEHLLSTEFKDMGRVIEEGEAAEVDEDMPFDLSNDEENDFEEWN